MAIDSYFRKLDSCNLLKNIFIATGHISELSRVCKFFHEAATKESKSLFESLNEEFGKNCVDHVLRKIRCDQKPDATKIDALFYAACQGGVKTEAHLRSGEYDVCALRKYMDPLLPADGCKKLWEALLKSAHPELKTLMAKVTFGPDLLINAELIRKFFEDNSGELQKTNSLDLSLQKLKVLPPEIAYFSKLNKLDISHNSLIELPKEIGFLTELTEFRANNNLLRSLPSPIEQLVRLQNFQCSSNQLTCFPIEICKMIKLRSLNLSRNRIDKLPDEIRNLQSLNYLYLESCKLTSLPTAVTEIPYLIGFYLFNNQLSALPDKINDLKHLKYFSVQNNQLTTLPEKIGGLECLQSLFVDGNKLTELPQSICFLSKLKQLSISNNKLSHLNSGMQELEQLVYFDYAGNSFEMFPKGIETLPFWSVHPHYGPRLKDEKEALLLNTALNLEGFTAIYWRLGKNKWKEGVDGVHHDFGSDVYDLGLHKKYAEPGYLNGIKRGFQFLDDHANEKINSQFYLALHKAACLHFKGKDTNTLMGQEKVGVFRSMEDIITATFSEPEYLMTQSAINEFNDLNGELILVFGSSFRIGDLILNSRKPRSISIYYNQCSKEQISILFNYFLTNFYYDIGHSQNKSSIIKAISKFIQRLEWLHPVRDGCGRTDTALLNYLLTIYGLNPVLLKLPYITSCTGIHELTSLLITGMQDWELGKIRAPNS